MMTTTTTNTLKVKALNAIDLAFSFNIENNLEKELLIALSDLVNIRGKNPKLHELSSFEVSSEYSFTDIKIALTKMKRLFNKVFTFAYIPKARLIIIK